MAANPTTAEILANLAEIIREAEKVGPITDRLRDDADTFAQRLADSLPDVDPVIAGRVLVHAADVYGMFATWDNKQPLSDEAFVAVWMLGEAGRRLYCGSEQGAQS
jgi:hypothetical protein